jgi:16S rRNA (cytosine967-C5)-methyltransferase
MPGELKPKSDISRGEISPGRIAAFDILLRVERESSYASELLHSRVYDRLSALDHSLATDLVMGVLRWRSRLDLEITAASAQSLARLDLEVLTAIRLALYQLRFLDRIPARAAINDSVELVKRARKRSAASFANAVLRKLVSETSSAMSAPLTKPANLSAGTIAETCAHPLWLVERWIAAYGFDDTWQICRGNQAIPVTSIRLRQPDSEAQLRAEGIEFTSGALLASARRVQRGDATKTNASKQGLYVIQDEASQLIAALVGSANNILDCCAAPGGKTLSISDRNPNSQIAAAELHLHRARLLRRLIAPGKTSLSPSVGHISVIAADACDLPFTRKFGRVLADVPCSGTGTLARNPEIKWRLKPEDLTDLQARQLAILRSAMNHVAAGGRLIYSTCSLEKEENEEVIERALEKNPSYRVLPCSIELDRLKATGELIWPEPASLSRGAYLRTLPGLQPCDGFFAAILEKV